MARIARVVTPGLPHHVTQRGNRRPTTFFAEGDYLWSRARHDLGQHVDPLIHQLPLGAMGDDGQTFLSGEVNAESRAGIGRTERSTRPLGDAKIVARLEGVLGRGLRWKKPGPKGGGNSVRCRRNCARLFF